MEVREIFLDKTHFSFIAEGQGETVVLLHGYLESAFLWKEVVEILKSEYFVVVPFLPGSDYSDNIDPFNSMGGMGQYVNQLMEFLEISSFHIVGHSMGGYVALTLADFFPAKCRSLVLCHSNPFPDSPEKKIRRERERFIIEAGKKELAIKGHVKQLFTKDFGMKNPVFVDQFVKGALGISAESMVATLNGMLYRKDRTSVVDRLGKRSAFLMGAKDQILSRIQMDSLRERFPLSEFFIIPQTGHMGIFEFPERACDWLVSFWKKEIRLK